MTNILNVERSRAIAAQVQSKPKKPFDNAFLAIGTLKQATYVQGFLAVVGAPYTPLEHGWLELAIADEGGSSRIEIIDPTLPHLHRLPAGSHYYAAQRLTRDELRDAIEEAKEDYPEDDPLPVYGDAPYEYYGDRMLGGAEYQAAYAQALAKCKELNQPKVAGNSERDSLPSPCDSE